MAVNPNPKKSRPYDEPPRRRRQLIPSGPDTAAIGFLVAAAVWFAVATGIGALALVMRIVTFEFAFPFGIFDLGFELNARRVEYAFVNASVYGWLSNAGFAAIVFMTPRLLGKPLAGQLFVNLGLAAWNLSLAGGIAALYVFDLGPEGPLTAMLWLFDGGLATGALIIALSFLVTVGTDIRRAYVSVWFAGIALLGIAGLVGLNAALGLLRVFVELPEPTVALASFAIERATVTVWLLGIAYAILHYVVPRATGLPLASGGLAILTFLTWLAFAPLSALAELRDTSVPVFLTTLGAVGTMLLLVPASLATVNLVQSMHGRWNLLFGAGSLAFASVALAFLISTALLEAIGVLGSVSAVVNGTEWDRGVFVWAAYGAFTMAALALAEHALPRILHRAWGSGPLSGAALWLVFGGATVAGVMLMGAGLAEGSLRSAGAAGDQVQAALLVYRAGAFLGWGLVALGGLAVVANLFVMYTSAERVDYVVPGDPAAAAAGH